MTLQPRGVPNHFSAPRSVTFAHLYLSDALLALVGDAIGQPCAGAQALRPDLIFEDDEVLNAAAVEYAGAAAAKVSALEMEARAILLTARLLRVHHGGNTQTRAREPGGLAPWQVRRLTDYLSENLDRDVGLSELARLVDLSPTHMCTAFRQSTGLPPHQWQMQARIARAVELLAIPQVSITEISLAVGYASPGHFATVFRKATGQSPCDWRRKR